MRPLWLVSAARMSSGNGIEVRTSAIGRSTRASTTENRPSVNSWSWLRSPSSGPSRSHTRARTSAVVSSSRGLPWTPANTVMVAQRLTLLRPSSAIARPMPSTRVRRPKNAELM